jgi:hypothetical protein
VPYPDPAAATSNKWLQWRIDLSDLPGADASAITKMIIGFGDRDAPVPGGMGTLFVDDIRNTK